MKKYLPTSGISWGVSCEVHNEAMLGALLAYASILGCTNIGWVSIKVKPIDHVKDPKAVARGIKGAAARAKNKKARLRLVKSA